jgi:hypothetical protein
MRIAADRRVPSASALRVQLSVLIAPLAALSYPYILTGFNASVTTITKSDCALPWLMAAVLFLLAFTVPTIALVAAMHFAEIRQPTLAQLRAKRMALLAVAAPTSSTYDAVMKIFRHVYRTEVLQPLLVTLFFFQIGTGLYLVSPRCRTTASVPFRSLRVSISPFTCLAT